MSVPSKYWELIIILPSGNDCGYGFKVLPLAKEFFLQEFPTLATRTNILDESVQNRLFELLAVSGANLCLRCYVSHFILRSCIQRAKLFAVRGRINYRDLLPFVLNDDGRTSQGTHIPFSVEILSSFRPERQCSLARWVDFRVKRHWELNDFLLEFDIEVRSDWAILNKAVSSHLNEQRDREILTAFYDIYRQARPKQHRNQFGGRCPDPTQEQLETMVRNLRKRNIIIDSPGGMLNELKRLAKLLRIYSLWGKTGSPMTDSLDESEDNAEQEYKWHSIADPTSKEDLLLKFEQLELQEFCQEQLMGSLDKSIKQVIEDHINKQTKSRGYASLAYQIKPILRLIYCEGKSQTQIANELGIHQLKVSRLINPSNLLKMIRRKTMEILLEEILEKAKQLGYVQTPLEPDYFDNLVQQLEAYVDVQVFQEAVAELRTSRTSAMESVYAQRLCFILNNQARDGV
ncbi:hypothetical protein F7734_38780 [Scytonema sp. UIC 10036]|uniref:hypothetical protein n=1 Tax=Scytonema sp. UIC 10036 TaxID=2304196 RepID=UPI0012DA227E|nr:hypothetical protein [Scytonema sp. UIC 10036]MUG97937.1 hypothetical protein [Scytonema sp. UIC 10036]